MLWPPWDGGCEICQKSDGPDGLDGLDGPDSVDAIFLASWIVKLGGEGLLRKVRRRVLHLASIDLLYTSKISNM